MKKTLSLKFTALAAASVLALISPHAHAASATWTGATSGVWANNANWTAAFPNSTADVATFNNNVNTAITLNGTGIGVNQLIFDTASVGSFTFGASDNTFTVSATGNNILMTSTVGAVTQTFNEEIRLLGASSITNDSTGGSFNFAAGFSYATGINRSISFLGSGSGNHTVGFINQTAAGVASVVINGGANNKWTFTGNNDYSGTTTVTTGTLVIDGNQSSATGTVSVASGATLGGSGTIGGATNLSGTLAAGNSAGTLTFASDLNVNNGSTVLFEAGDLINVNGVLDLNNSWTLNLQSGANWQLGGSTVIFDYATLAASPFLTPTFIDNTGLGGSLSLIDNGSAIVLNGYSVVPEPSTWAMLAIGLTTLTIFRRRSARLS